MATEQKIVKYKGAPRLNIGIVIFVVILVYMMYHLFTYLTAEHISIYEVEYGTIAESNTYQGLLLREEEVFYSDFGGAINYYLKDASKASVKTLIYSVDESGSIANLIAETAAGDVIINEASAAAISETIHDYAVSSSRNTFFRVYDFKEAVESEIMEALNLAALEAVSASGAYAAGAAGFHMVTSAKDGVAVYYVDGYEGVTADTFTPEMMNELNYDKISLKTAASVTPGSPVYKLLRNEDWDIVVAVDENIYQMLAEKSVIQIRFLEDNKTVNANLRFRDINGQHYLILSLNNSMIRYANDRFTEIELMLEEQTGLKIPNSAITEKEFFVVPKGYFAQGGDSSDYGVLMNIAAESETPEYQFQPTELYYETEDAYYISDDAISAGTMLMEPGSGQLFTVGETATLSGVYNVNKGYAVFKQIVPLYQNAEYTIVKTGTSYGISLYDHIALEGNEVSEGELVN